MFKLKTNEEFSDKLKNKIIAESKGFELISFKNPNKNTFVTGFNINVNLLDQLKYKDSLTKYFVTPQLFQNIEELLVSNYSEDVFFEKIILLNNSFLENTLK